MKKHILDIIHYWLVLIAFIMGIVFGLLLVGHSAHLLIERVINKEKSEKRWEQINEKFERHHIIRNDSIYKINED